MDQHNRMLLARAVAAGKTDGIVMVATEMGRTAEVITAAAALGAQIQARFDDVGYFRVRLPLSRFERLQTLPGVLIAQLDGSAYVYQLETDFVRYEKPKLIGADSIRADSIRRDSTARDSARVAALPLPPARALEAESPFSPMNDMRSYDLRRMDPRFDGRGVTIAVLEGGTLDFLHPALRFALDAKGDTVPKIRGVLSPLAYEPYVAAPRSLVGDQSGRLGFGHLAGDRNAVRRIRMVTVTDSTFTADDTTYTMPERGTYSFGRFTRGKATWAVLWDEARKLVWVDTNGDKSFADEQPLSDINTRFSAGMLTPLDSTEKEPKRAMSFAVQFDSIPGRVRLHVGTQGHQLMVATVAAGHNLLGGAADASAPGAQILIVDAGNAVYQILEGFVRAERDPRVDLITCSQVGGAFPGVGESLLSLIVNRAIEVYGKPFLASAGNAGPASNSTGEPGATPRVISVGGYVSAETYRAHYGWELPRRDWLIHYSSRGPEDNGGLKPDLVAPVLSVAGEVCSYMEVGKTLTYQFPRCWDLGGGTSSASPHAAGAAALLLSAARQSGLHADGRRLAWALRMGARYLAEYAAHEQGNGLVDVVRAFELLKLDVALPEIESRAPVRSVLAPYLREPGYGDGLYLREGWTAGDARTETITLTRRSGPTAPMRYALRWRGNGGTFSTAQHTVTLPLNTPVRIPVRVAPTVAGMHSAQLQLVDLEADVPVHEVLATVVAAERFTPENGYTVRRTASIPWQSAHSVFVEVPRGTAALRIDLAVATGKVNVQLSDMTSGDGPTGWRPHQRPSEQQQVVGGQSATLVVPVPDPGVMEILVEPFNEAKLGADSAQYHVTSEVELTVAALHVEAGNRAGTAARIVRPGDAAPLAFTNRGAALAGAAAVSSVGIRRELAGRVEPGRTFPEYIVIVDSGATSLRVATTSADSSLSLYLYDCGGEKCALWDALFTASTRKSLTVVQPRAGLWKVLVVPTRTARAPAAFTYTEVVTHPKYGTADSTVAGARAVGATWSERGVYRALATPPPGYELVGVTDVVDEAMERSERERPLVKFQEHLTPYRPARLATVVVPLRPAVPATHAIGAEVGRE
jgi:hypothetical protein